MGWIEGVEKFTHHYAADFAVGKSGTTKRRIRGFPSALDGQALSLS